jgi:hypothetical protein
MGDSPFKGVPAPRHFPLDHRPTTIHFHTGKYGASFVVQWSETSRETAMSSVAPDLWELALNRRQIDPSDLVSALESQASRHEWDYRTRLLIRDSLDGLARAWGAGRVKKWLGQSARLEALKAIWESPLGPAGFESLPHRIMETTKPETILQFFRELGLHLHHPTRVDVGGAASLILAHLLSRRTEDIDVVNEVPLEMRSQHELLNSLADRYHIRLTHFQSHYLPTGWDRRVMSLGVFDRLSVFLVDPYDVFVGKLFSSREKDLDDLRELASRLEKSRIEARVRESAAPLRSEAKWADAGARNWYIVFGDSIPS